VPAEPEPTFAQLLRRARREAGITQEELAEQAGISPRAISSLERGINRAPRRDTLELIFAALDLSPDEQARWERTRRRLATRAGPDSNTSEHAHQTHLRAPAPLTSFLGRDQELSEVQQILSQARLVTVTGPGGIGKTRLGLALAEQEHRQFRDGVFFVPLAATASPDLVAVAIMRAVGLDENAARSPAETLSHFMRKRSILLFLDNFEHVLAAAPLVSQLLEACPQIKALVTSRVPLRLSGEREYPLRPLGQEAAAALFVERMREIRPAFDPGDELVPTIGEICRCLDGLPLAIELAASRGRVLTLHTLLEKLEHPLDILSGGPRDAPERQQTLRNTIAWSYDLLQPEDQELFRTLAVFRDGWSFEAAEAVMPAGQDILECMATLVESSLIEPHLELDGEPRFRMLETVREFGLDLLKEHETEQSVRERHARYMASIVLLIPPLTIGPDLANGLDRLETEHANLQLALDWFLRHDVETGLRMVACLSGFWWIRSHLTVGRRYCDLMLDATDDSIDVATVASALCGAGVITLAESDLSRNRARHLHEQALSIFLDLQDPPEGSFWSFICLGLIEAREGNLQDAAARYLQAMDYSRRHNQQYGILTSRLMLAIQSSWQGQLDDALSHCEAALTLAHTHDFHDPWTTGVISMNLAVIYIQQERYDDAWPLLNEALGLARQLKNSRDTSWALERMAAVEMIRGHITAANALFVESLDAANRAGETRGIGKARLGLGQVALLQEQPREAIEWFRRALEICLEAGNLQGIADSMEGLASATALLGKPQRAVQLHAAATAYCERVGIATSGGDRSALEHEYVTVQQALTAAAFDEAWEAGHMLTPEQIVLREVQPTPH
jgi:predicted ATPase/DNA-binding XRE family transcriptional regulator